MKIFATQSIPVELDQQHLPSLNGLRAISIIVVISSHAMTYSSISWLTRIPGNFGVSIFFVLSGFLITTLLLKEKIYNEKISLKNFYLRRGLRIFPVAFLFCITLVILNYRMNLGIPFISQVSGFLFFRNLVISNDLNQFNSHLWSLSVEEQFYIVFPAILVYLPKFYPGLVFILCLFSPFLMYFDAHSTSIFKIESIHLVASILKMQTGIFVGSAAALITFRFPQIIQHLNKFVNTTPFLIIIASLLQIKGLSIIPDSFLIISDGIIALVIISSVGRYTCWFTRLLNSSIMNRIGILSYSLYIWQELFLFKSIRTGKYLFFQHCWLNCLSVFVVGWLSYYCFEKFFLNLKKHFSSSKREVKVEDLIPDIV